MFGFDLIHAPLTLITKLPLINAAPNPIGDSDVTPLMLEIHKSCLLVANGNDPVVGVWATASLRQGQRPTATPPSGHPAPTR